MIKIDVDTRYWKIPKEECFLGVESDDKVKILQFELSKNEFYDGLNFTDCNCFINYKNEDNDTIPYGITDMALKEDGTVTFTWEVSRGATIFKGNTFAVLCAKKVREDGTITNEWNSRIGSFTVSKGLEPSSSIVEVPEIDIISQLLLVAQETNTNAQNNIEQSNTLLEKAEGLGYLKEEYDVLESRMNQFTSLQEGSTTGDAELIDGRIGYDGTVYDNIGGAIRKQVSELKGDLVDFKSDLNFEKGSVNLLDEESIDFNNKIITNTGTLSNDDRGFRVYVLDVGVGNTVTVSIDQNWFYGIQADGNSIDSLSSINLIKDVDTTTYFDSSTQNTKTEKTVTMTHKYLWLCFLHENADSSLSLYTSKIMVNIGDSPLPYEPYKVIVSVDVTNKKYDSTIDLSVYEQAYINNCELVANYITPENNAVAQYTGAKLTGKVINVRAKVKFYGSAFCTFISEPNGLYSVTDVIDKSVHINMSRSICYVGYFDGRKLTNTKVINYSVDEGVEVTVGFNIDISTNTITVYLPNGETYTETNAKYTECAGEYAMWEHYKGSVSSGFVCNHFTKIYAKDENGKVLCDDFKREDGAIGIAPQGYVYGQFTNLNQTNWVL